LPRFDVVLFDLDGTLIDSAGAILESFHGTTEAVLGRRFPDDRILALVGGGSPARQMAQLDATRVDDLVREYGARIDDAYDEVECFAGVAEVLAELKHRGQRLGVVSAKSRPTVERAFEAAGIDGLFDVVVGSDATTRHKPDPEPILHALSLLGTAPGAAAYVGDSPFDAAAARAAGVYAVAVAWGRIHRVEDADVLVENPEELLAVL
jgi:pyrophosphatase PpaX